MRFTFPVLLTAAGCGTWFSWHRNTDNRSVHLKHSAGTRPPRWTSSRDGPEGRFPLGKTSVHLATTAPHHATALSGADPGFRSDGKPFMCRDATETTRQPRSASERHVEFCFYGRRTVCLSGETKRAGGRSLKRVLHVLTSRLNDRVV